MIHSKLVISGLPEGYHQLFLDMADAMNLSTSQLLVLLMASSGAVDGGVSAAIPDEEARTEWKEHIATQIFKLHNL